MFKSLTPARRIAFVTLSIVAIALAASTAGTLLADVGALPYAQTGVVGTVGSNTATIFGQVSGYNYSTSYYAEYGTTNSLGATSASKTVSTQSDANVSLDISGLSADTTYYYRLTAQNQNGVSRGELRTFKTLSDASGFAGSVTTNAVINPGSYSATLNGYVLDPGTSGGSAFFMYGSSRENLSLNSDTVQIQGIEYYRTTVNRSPIYSVQVNNLTAGTTYFYKAAFRSSSGGTAYGPISSFATGAAPAGYPSALPNTPAPVAGAPIVSATNLNGISSRGAAVGAVVNAAGYATTLWYEYGTTSSFGQKSPAYPAGSAQFAMPTIQSLTDLISNTTYYVRAVAQNQNGIGYGPTVSFQTPSGTAQEEAEPVIIAAVSHPWQQPLAPIVTANYPTGEENIINSANYPQVQPLNAALNTFVQNEASVSKNISLSSAAVVNFVLLLLVLGIMVWILSRPRLDFDNR